MEPVTTTVLATVTLGGPILEGLAKLTAALKEPGGRKKVEELRQELAQAIDGINALLTEHENKIVESERKSTLLLEQADAQARLLSRALDQCDSLAAHVTYLRLPIWKRWFTAAPTISTEKC